MDGAGMTSSSAGDSPDIHRPLLQRSHVSTPALGSASPDKKATTDNAKNNIKPDRIDKEIAKALERSVDGARLIEWDDLPQTWKYNPYVTRSYRFIPPKRWHLLVMSIFTLHNETLNIQTHFIPFILLIGQSAGLIGRSHSFGTQEGLYVFAAVLCLLCSIIWHTTSGCAHKKTFDTCAKADYVGIGWLISISVGNVNYYGFRCHRFLSFIFLAMCFASAVAGSIAPFTVWFNDDKNRRYRIAFFVCMAYSVLIPLAVLSMVYSVTVMMSYMGPLWPSLGSYMVGLVIYALHFPERFLPESVRKKFDIVGAGSHAIWHCFIILAIYLHLWAMETMRNGIVEQCPPLPGQ